MRKLCGLLVDYGVSPADCFYAVVLGIVMAAAIALPLISAPKERHTASEVQEAKPAPVTSSVHTEPVAMPPFDRNQEANVITLDTGERIFICKTSYGLTSILLPPLKAEH